MSTVLFKLRNMQIRVMINIMKFTPKQKWLKLKMPSLFEWFICFV